MTVAQDRAVRLTERQWQAVRLMAQGLKTDEIADVMGTSPHTVKYHLEAVRNKLRLDSRREIPYTLQQLGYKVFEE